MSFWHLLNWLMAILSVVSSTRLMLTTLPIFFIGCDGLHVDPVNRSRIEIQGARRSSTTSTLPADLLMCRLSLYHLVEERQQISELSKIQPSK